MLNILFPYITHLHILQLEGYQVNRFLNWLKSNYFKRVLEEKKALVWTAKTKVIFGFSLCYGLLLVLILSYFLGFIGFSIGVIFLTQPYVFLILGVWSLKPYEIIRRSYTKRFISNKVLSCKKLKVIGITGSYGKTSTKEFLTHILKSQFKVLKTPLSYNTLFGIAKVVELELDDTYDFFICEMGAYHTGEIKELCETVHPTYAILTGINEQHLERFGSLENTTLAKFELIETIPSAGFGIVNTDNKIINENYKRYIQTQIFTYGFNDNKFSVKDIETSESGTKFKLLLRSKNYDAQTILVGRSNLSNVIAASAMAYKLGVNYEKIIAAIKTLKPVPHRLEIKLPSPKTGGITFIDDAYNSNIDGFKEALNLLSEFKKTESLGQKKETVLVTPGIVELGNKTAEVHKMLGEIADKVCDYILLVGENERTQAFAESVANKNKIRFLKSISELHQVLKELNLKNPVVLLENDLPDNY